eukprot:523713_1
MSADRSRIASEGSQMAALLVEGSPLQMEKGVGGVRAHGGIDRSGNKNTTAIANGNNNKVGSSSNNYDLSRHGIWEQPNTEIAKEQEELDYIDDVRDSCVSSAVNNSHTIREGSILDLNSYFLSHSMRNNHKRIEEPFSIRFKEQSHIKHQIQNYLENCVHVQVQHTLESKLPQSQVKLPSDDGTAATGLSPLSLSSCDNMNATPLSQTTTTAASRLEPSLMIEKHTELRSIKEELEEIELKEVQILAEQAQLYRRKQKLLQNCFSKSNTTQCASVHKSSPIYHKHYYSSSVSSSGPQPQSMMTSDTECPPPLSHHPSSKTPPPSPLEQSVEYHKLHCQTYQPHGISGSGIFIEQKGGEKGNKLLSSTAMSPLSGIGLSEMELVSSLMIYYRLSTILLDRLDCMWTLLEIIRVLGLGAGLKNLILNPISLSPFISHIVCCYHLQADASTSLCDA